MNASTAPTDVDHNPAADKAWDDCWRQRCEALNWANITYRYHRKRQWFFDFLEKFTQAGSVLMGASLLGKTMQDHLPLAAAIISALGLLALVFGYSDRRQAHKELACEAMQMVGRIEGTPVQQLDDACLCRWQQDMAALNLREPPNLKTLVLMCEREQAVAEGHMDHIKAPSLLQRLHAHWF